MKRILAIFTLACIGLGAAAQNAKTELNVATFNIRMDTNTDKENAWPNRKVIATEFVKNYKLDIIGTQEVLHHQLTDMLSLLPNFTSIGVGRTNGREKGEYSAILYNTERFRPIESNTFWLAEDTTAVGKKGWDAACERIVTWALMEEISTGKRFYFFNTHFDHRGPEARINSAHLLTEKICAKRTKHPIIVTGDFNATMDSNVYQAMTATSTTPLIDSRSIAKKIEGPAWSAHSWAQTPIEKRNIIDYIFVTEGVEAQFYKSVFEDHKGVYISDHNPIVTKLILP